MTVLLRSSGRAAWLALVGVMAAVSAATLIGPSASSTWENPELLFTLVTVTAAAASSPRRSPSRSPTSATWPRSGCSARR
ncbi:MAG: hypothetical protein R2697_00305 [Ilumatobacteraceae bacterium]